MKREKSELYNKGRGKGRGKGICTGILKD